MSKLGMIKHRDVLNAWLDGAEVEYSDKVTWIGVNVPSWGVAHEYRIKPQPKFIEGWMNMYPGWSGNMHKTISEANDMAAKSRIACVHIKQPYEEGEGLE